MNDLSAQVVDLDKKRSADNEQTIQSLQAIQSLEKGMKEMKRRNQSYASALGQIVPDESIALPNVSKG